MKRYFCRILCLAAAVTVFTGCAINKVGKNETLYFVGGFSNWTFEPMRRDANNPYRFTLGRVMTWKGNGNFKFGSKTNTWENQYHPFVSNAPFTYSMAIRDSDKDNTWLLHEEECGRAYKMSFDTGKWPMEFKMAPFDPWPALYLAGDAAGGQDFASGYAMEIVDGNPFIMSWYGTLKPGRLSFAGFDGDRGAWLEPWRDGLAPDGLEQQIETAGEGGGRAWNIEKEGNYLIILDQLQDYAVIIADRN